MRVAPSLQVVPNWRRVPVSVIREEDLDLRGHEHTGCPLGDEAFSASLEKNLGRTVRRQKPGPKGKQRELSKGPTAPGGTIARRPCCDAATFTQGLCPISVNAIPRI